MGPMEAFIFPSGIMDGKRLIRSTSMLALACLIQKSDCRIFIPGSTSFLFYLIRKEELQLTLKFPIKQADMQPLKILIADDETEARALLLHYLQAEKTVEI